MHLTWLVIVFFLEISRLIAYSIRLFFKKYLASITCVPCVPASHHDTSPLVYKYLCTQTLAQACAFVPMEANDGADRFPRPGMQKSARVNFAIGFAFYVAGGRLARFSLLVSL